jgi:acetyl-CoA synthetase
MAPEIATASPNLTSSLRENRVFPPPPAFAERAHIGSLEEYRELYRRSVEQPDEFWADAARELQWFRKPKQVLEGETRPAGSPTARST